MMSARMRARRRAEIGNPIVDFLKQAAIDHPPSEEDSPANGGTSGGGGASGSFDPAPPQSDVERTQGDFLAQARVAMMGWIALPVLLVAAGAGMLWGQREAASRRR